MFTKLLLSLLFLVCANTANAKTVTLLVSLDPQFYPHGIAALVHDYAKYPEKLETTFRAGMSGSGYEIKVVQNATRYDLYEALHSPENTGVFWVSHEAPVSYNKGGIEIDPELVDVHQADVKDVFKQMNPSIQWVSLVACDSDLIINWLKGQVSQQTVSMRTFDNIQGFNQVIDANKGLKQAIDLSKKTLTNFKDQASPSVCSEARGFPMTVRRDLSASNGEAYFPSVTIEFGGVAIAAFPEVTLQAGESTVQETQATLQVEGPNVIGSQLTLVVQSGFSTLAVPTNFQMGDVSISGGWEGASWKTFTQPDGTPFGVTQRLLTYDGASFISSDPIPFQPDAC